MADAMELIAVGPRKHEDNDDEQLSMSTEQGSQGSA